MDRAAARRRGRTVRLLALTAAGAAHVALVGLLAVSLVDRRANPPGPQVETPLVSLDLATPRPRSRRTKRPRATLHQPHASRSPVASPQAPNPPQPPTAAPGAANPAQAAADADDARVRSALRSLAGCAFGSTEAERERCEQRFAQGTRQARALPVGPADPRKRARLEHELRVDEAFRAYRRSPAPDDYPGLRTFIPGLKPLFGDEPIPRGEGPGPH